MMQDSEHVHGARYGRSRTEKPWYTYSKKLIFDSTINRRGKVLDVGCGHCGFSLILKELGFDVHVIDGRKEYIAYAKKLGFAGKVADFNKNIPYQDKTFDGLACLEVIEHITGAENLLKEMHRILKKNGWLVISTPNISWLLYRAAPLLGYPPSNEGYHFRFFTHKTLRKKLSEFGFEVIKDSSFISLPLINGILDRRGRKPLFPKAYFWKNLMAQNLVFLCRKV